MPKGITYLLLWSPEDNDYGLWTQDEQGRPLLWGETEGWFAWLSEHRAFVFRGKEGAFSLQKEQRRRGQEGYWYGYRRQGRRMVKAYLGKSSALSMARLEAAAVALAAPRNAATGEPLQKRAQASEMMQRENHVSVQAEERQSENDLLLASKLCPPRLPSSFVARERLLNHLDTSLNHKLTLITAPAGWGKTTLVSHWLHERRLRNDIPPTAWLSLDVDDNNPTRFWRSLLTACQPFQTDGQRSALVLLEQEEGPPFSFPPLKKAVTLFLNEITQKQKPGLLILEDYQVVTDQAIHAMMAFFINNLPSTAHLIVLTRVEPPFPLTALRAQDELVEVDADDLRFSPEETRRFLQQALPVQPESSLIVHLDTYLEGWITGLRLLSLIMQKDYRSQESADFPLAFRGSHAYVLDYFVSQVLDAQPEALQAFLLQTSFLKRLTASLCNAATGGNDSQSVLTTIEHAGLFLQMIGDDGQWYRYHALFAEAMQAEALKRLPQEVYTECLMRAAVWYEQSGFLSEAIDVTLQARAYPQTVALLERYMDREQQYSDPHDLYRLQTWLQQLPETLVLAHPALSFINANVLTFLSASDHLTPTTRNRVQSFLDGAEQGWRQTGQFSRLGEVSAFRALLAARQGSISEAATLARQALTWLSDEQPVWRTICLGVIGEAERQAGQIARARRYYQETLSLCQSTNNRPGRRVALLYLGEVCSEAGELRQAATFFRQVLEEAGDDISDLGKALAGLAKLSYEWNDLERAREEAQKAFDLGRQLEDVPLQVLTTLLLVRIAHTRGEIEQAHERLSTLLAHISSMHMPHLTQIIRITQARLYQEIDPLAEPLHWFSPHMEPEKDLPQQYHLLEVILQARWLLARGNAQETLTLLDPWEKETRDSGQLRYWLEIQVLRSIAYHQLKHVSSTRLLLRQVISLAASEGYIRIFLDEGETLLKMLRPLVSRIREKQLQSYLQHLLKLFVIQSSRVSTAVSEHLQLYEELSLQELQVLRLLAEGYSRKEIAEALVITINTVKTHLTNIYQKMHVHSRFEACRRARQLDLLQVERSCEPVSFSQTSGDTRVLAK